MSKGICPYCHRSLTTALTITASGKPVPDGIYHVQCYREELHRIVNR